MAPERKPETPIRAVLVVDTPSLATIADQIADIDRDITTLQNSQSLYPRSHSERNTWVYKLCKVRWERYLLSQDKEDLDKTIVHCTEAIFLPPVSWAYHPGNIVHLLVDIAFGLLKRFEEFKQPHDIKYSIEYYQYLRGLPLESFDVPRHHVTTSLIRALGVQVGSEAGDGTRKIKEIVVYCRELLTSTLSAGFPYSVFLSLNEAVEAEVLRGRVQLVDEVIEFLRDAVKLCPPDSYDVSIVLANQLYHRFKDTHSNDDYEEATTLLERILDPNQPGECSDSMRDLAPFLVTELAYTRSIIFDNPQYSEASISRLRTFLSSPSVDEHHRLKFTNHLANLIRKRSEHYSLADFEEANTYTARLVALSSQSLPVEESGEYLSAVLGSYSTKTIGEKIQHLKELLSITPPGTDRHKVCLSYLTDLYDLKFQRTDDISDIEESIKYRRLELEATHSSNDDELGKPLEDLSHILFSAFRKTGNISYLNESITLSYDILKLKGGRHLHFRIVKFLVRSLCTRALDSWEFLEGRKGSDCYEAIRLISMVIDNQYVREHDRFILSCNWALIARTLGHPTILTAYKCAMSLMQKSLSSAPTVSIQHTRLVAMAEHCLTMPLDYASIQIYLGQFEEAIETLEQGRALIWSEMRGLRAPVAQLIENLPFAKRFAEINQELEELTTSDTPSGRPEMEHGVAQGRDLMDPFGRLVVKQQKLVEERNALISQIQGRPGLIGFLKAPPFTTLRSAASRGPVILINHCEWRSDILIIFHNLLPCSIPTIEGFYTRANDLRDELVGARKDHGLDSSKYQDALCSVLKGLYDLIGEPVIKMLRMLGVPEQSRIWWCPTSVFCSLPLHAMGPIPSSNPRKQYFSDLYIPSYTPSLSALIESRKASPQMLDKPSLLLVAQPDDSLPGVRGEIKVIQRTLKELARATVTTLVSSEATPTSVVEGLRSSQLAHFACHGILETGKPFEASFKLHGGSRLTLLDLVRSRLPDAEFAFLSCCHTAEITEESIADEALHLTAAMQYCGFRSVVGTMWEMADTDGLDLAKSFYKSLFSSRETGVPYYERSAGALRDATQKLRDKRGITLERWVNFVHYGA
jgi:tetratricopeptide (TPR) repeat protein